MNTTQFLDKQIMDLSNSQTNEFTDLINTSEDHHHITSGAGRTGKEEIFPNYDFQPIRPLRSSSPPRNIDSVNVNVAGARAWSSADSKANSSPVRNYGSLDSLEPAKALSGKDRNPVDATLVSEIDQTMKKYTDNLLHALDGVSARLSQLETRSRQLENSMDDLKLVVGNNHGSTDGKMRQLENMLREVQTSVQVIKDKQEIMDTQLQLAKLQVSKVDKQPDAHSPVAYSAQSAASAPLQSHQEPPPLSHSQPLPSFAPPNAPPPPLQQNMPQHVQLPNQFATNQVPSVPQREPYFPQPDQTQENAGQQYHMPPPLPLQSAPQPPPQQQYQTTPQPQFSEMPPPPHLHQQVHPLPTVNPSQLPTVNPSQPQPPSGHRPEEISYMQSQNYPPGSIPLAPHQSAVPPTSQQFYGAPSNMYEPQASRPGPGFSGAFGSPSGPVESYPYSSSTSQFGGVSPRKPQQLSAPPMSHTAGTGYPQLPTAKILPHALPTASPVGGGSGSAAGNRVPVDDVVDKVTNMGFPRDQVRATVRKLTENGQAVDLNVVLDKLMNDGGGQPPRGWYGQ